MTKKLNSTDKKGLTKKKNLKNNFTLSLKF